MADPLSFFSRQFAERRLSNAKAIVGVRLIGAGAWVGLAAFLPVRADLKAAAPLIGAYLALAVGLGVAFVLSDWVRRNSFFAVAFLDTPAVWGIHVVMTRDALRHPGLQTGAAALPVLPVDLAVFAVGVFALVILISVLSLERANVILAGAVAIVLQFELLLEVEADYGHRAGSVLVLGLCTFVGYTLVGQIRSLVEQAAEREKLSRYFSPEILRKLSQQETEMAGETREVTVLFSDLRDFTSMSQSLESSKVVKLLNEYLTEMGSVIFSHNGTVDKFIGDGIMAYWGAPSEQPDHAVHAVSCALDMAGALERPCSAIGSWGPRCQSGSR